MRQTGTDRETRHSLHLPSRHLQGGRRGAMPESHGRTGVSGEWKARQQRGIRQGFPALFRQSQAVGIVG